MQLIQPIDANMQHHDPATTVHARRPPSGKSAGLGPVGLGAEISSTVVSLLLMSEDVFS